ncbi:MAG: Glu-tRNA(Gln) amidotransferase subunit GatE [Candidatus Thorarchaeota archaeon]
MLAKTVEFEALRQEKLLEIRDTLRNRGITAEKIKDKITDVSAVFANSESKVIKKALKSGGTVYAVKLPGFAGLLGIEVQPERRFGTEISDYAKFWGRVGGIFHTDELPKYGISDTDVSAIRKVLKTKDEDAVVLVASSKNRCKDALNAVVNRARDAIRGVPAETRMPLPEGLSKFARPRPGSSRMYPETDVRPVKITENRLKRIKKNMPETLDNKEKRFIKEYNLSSDLAYQITRSVNLGIFEHIINETKVSPTLVVTTLENTVVSLHRNQVPTENLQENHFFDLFKLVEQNELSSQAIPDVLTHLANNPSLSVAEALVATGLTMASGDEVAETIRKIVQDREEFVREQGERSFGGLMGIVMKELGGKVDGKTVKQILTDEINKLLKT